MKKQTRWLFVTTVSAFCLVGCPAPLSTVEIEPPVREHHATWTPQWASLIVYWPINNDWLDAVSNQDGVSSAASFSPLARLGSASGSFNGSTSYVNTLINIQPAQKMTLAFWINPAALVRAKVVTRAYFPDSLNGPYFSWSVETGVSGRVSFAVTTGPQDTSSTESIRSLTPNAWNHLAATYDGTTLKIYLDGVLESSTPANYGGDIDYGGGSSETVLGAIKSGSWGPLDFFNGQIDEFAVWNKDLTADEIKTVFDHQR